MKRFTNVFKALSDGTRLRIMRLIVASDCPVCVCELADALQVPQYQVSRHLAALRHAGLVTDARKGTWVYYAPTLKDDAFFSRLYDLLRNGVDHETFERDVRRLKVRLGLRSGGECVLGSGDPKVAEALRQAYLGAVEQGSNEEDRR